MNNIRQLQNTNNSIDKLSSQRQLYSKAKTFFTLRLLMSILIAIIGPILITQYDKSRPYVALISIIYIFFDIIVLKKIESKNRENAAKIQELFDIKLFGLEWNNVVAGNKPDMEMVYVNSEKYKKKNNTAALFDWYPKGIESLDLMSAALVCQRSNIWWDVSLRKIYIKILFSALSFFAIFFAVVSIAKNLDIQKILETILPILPLISILVSQIESQISTVSKMDSLKEKIESLINVIVENNCTQIDVEGQIRSIQDAIFLHRESCFSLPNWLYGLFMKKYEKQMEYNADTHILKLSRTAKRQ